MRKEPSYQINVIISKVFAGDLTNAIICLVTRVYIIVNLVMVSNTGDRDV
jgi:hypothetical protein